MGLLLRLGGYPLVASIAVNALEQLAAQHARALRTWAISRKVAVQADQTHREQAEHIHAKLAEQLQTLRFLQYELRQRSAQDVDERTRARAVATAIEHLQQAVDALEIAAHG